MDKLKSLRQLVKSLTESERMFFRSYSICHDEEMHTNCFMLFESLVESAIVDIMPNAKPMRTLQDLEKDPKVVDNLWTQMMRALLLFHEEGDIQGQIRTRVREAALMQERCLHEQADRLVTEARGMATKYERFYEQLDIINLEKSSLHRIRDCKESAQRRQELEKEEKLAMMMYRNYLRYRNLSKRISEIYRLPESIDRKNRLERLEKIFESDLLTDEDRALSLSARYYFHHERSTYSYYQGEIETAYAQNKALLSLIRQNPFLIDISLNGFVVTLFNGLVFSLELGQFDDFEERMTEFRRVPKVLSRKHTERFRRFIFERATFLELSKKLYQADYSAGIEMIPAVAIELKSFPGGIDPYFEAQFYYLFAYFHFIEEEFDQALKWVARLMTVGKYREDVYINSLVLSHILKFEKTSRPENQESKSQFRSAAAEDASDDCTTFSEEVRETLGYLEQSNRSMKTEKAILSTLDNVFRHQADLSAKTSTAKADKKAFSALKAELSIEEEGAYHPETFGQFDYLAWLDAKISGQRFSEVVSTPANRPRFRMIR